MPSTALPGKAHDVECDLMFYKQEHKVFHRIDRCIRCGAGIEIQYTTKTGVLYACHQCWTQH
eukprot:9497115-Pyramimonas_sp.AAC.1